MAEPVKEEEEVEVPFHPGPRRKVSFSVDPLVEVVPFDPDERASQEASAAPARPGGRLGPFAGEGVAAAVAAGLAACSSRASGDSVYAP